MKQLLTLLLIFTFSAPVMAKDLKNRLGVGYDNQLDINTPSITARYYPYHNLGFSASLGIDTGTANSSFGLLLKAYKTIFPEEHMNFFVGGGAGLISKKENSVDRGSGFEILATVGGEFFIPGLESLGFTFEAGVGVVSLDSDVDFRTIGHSPLHAGMIFYF